MDYKEKYNKLVEAIKALQNANASNEAVQNWVYDNVPELREGEDYDNKIINALKKGFRYHQLFNPTFGGIPCVEIMNWLEKQDEVAEFKKTKYKEKIKEFVNMLNDETFRIMIYSALHKNYGEDISSEIIDVLSNIENYD